MELTHLSEAKSCCRVGVGAAGGGGLCCWPDGMLVSSDGNTAANSSSASADVGSDDVDMIAGVRRKVLLVSKGIDVDDKIPLQFI